MTVLWLLLGLLLSTAAVVGFWLQMEDSPK